MPPATVGKQSAKSAGSNCRDRERDDRNANDRLTQVTAAKATTDRARELEQQITEIKSKLGKGDNIGAVNPLAKAPSNIIPGLGEGVASRMQALIALVFEMCIVAMLIGYEALGHVSTNPRSGKATATAGVARVEPVVVEPARVPDRPRPNLAVTTRQPIGALLDFLHDGVDIIDRERTEMSDGYLGYSSWCKARGLRPLDVDAFATDLLKLCSRFGIPVREEAGSHFLINVRIKKAS
jgi:hypothetical protein